MFWAAKSGQGFFVESSGQRGSVVWAGRSSLGVWQRILGGAFFLRVLRSSTSALLSNPTPIYSPASEETAKDRDIKGQVVGEGETELLVLSQQRSRYVN